MESGKGTSTEKGRRKGPGPPRLTLPKAPDPSPRSPPHNSHYLVCNFSVCL